MPAAKPALKKEPSAVTKPENPRFQGSAAIAVPGPRRLPANNNGSSSSTRPVLSAATARPRKETSFQARVPVITGEASYRGSFPVDGIISGQLGANGSALTIKQRPRNGPADSGPELDGELSFKDMLRINGHVAGKIFSFKGTLIVDVSARVDANIDVAVAVISGIVNGDVVGQERVEIGPGAVINGNISTRSIAIKPGAVFQGDCKMLKNENGDK